MSYALADSAALTVLWRRDLLRFFREKTRIAGALIQPLMFWWVIGTGMTRSFQVPGQPKLSYLEYFFPGIVLMVILFTSIFATMSVIEDRHSGFLQGVLVTPATSFAVVLGKSLGGSSVALLQGLAFALLAPMAGYPYMLIDWVALGATMLMTALALNALGFAVAWWLDSVQGYHVIMSLVLIPAWVVSGAVFPATQSGWLSVVVAANPLSYALSAMQRSLGAHRVLVATGHCCGPSPLWFVAAFCVAALIIGSVVCARKR